MSNLSMGRRLALRSRAGQALVEFVLVAPLMLLLIFGLVEFARAWNIRHVITDAAREGTRVMAASGNPMTRDTADARQSITDALNRAGLSYANATVTYTISSAGVDPYSQVTVVYPYTLSKVGILLGWAVPKRGLQIRTQFTMRNE